MSNKSNNDFSEAADLVAQVDTGARTPYGWQQKLIPLIAFIWACFQLYIASNLPFTLSDLLGISLIVTDSNARLIHLAFASFLAAMVFPLFKTSPRDYIPWYDWLLGTVAIVSCMYIFVFRDSIAVRAGLPTTSDLIIATCGIIVLAISVYRSLGLPLMIISSIFVIYVFFGHADWIPDSIRWKGASYNKAMWHYWMQGEGVFGVALGVSARLIFLFVLFGAILEKAGAGNYFIKLAFSLLGHFRGGPAKAAVVASAMSGLYSGSSIANTVTTGTFTIPLMKRTGFSAEKAGAVEVASSTNGQLTPPVMGAAAFLIAEFTGIAYTDILKHALVPALISYIALVYIVHLEALKLNLQGLPKPKSNMSLMFKIIGFLTGFIGVGILFSATYFCIGWIKEITPNLTFLSVCIISLIAYLILLWLASRRPDLQIDEPDAPITELPRTGDTALTGLYFILPIIILIWCIMPTPDRLSPALSAFWATLAMIVVALTHRPLKALMRGNQNIFSHFKLGVKDWALGMISGARNMIGIGIATAAAGIIIGTISLTGAHQVIGAFVEAVSGGNLFFMLILVAVMSLILGMGLPTTANYIVVSSLMAPVLVSQAAQSGLLVPLVAVHLFVFYFGILADDTPPVGLAAFAAAAISGGDPIKTGIQGFTYDIRTALLPFIFLFNTELLLINVSFSKAIVVFIVAVIAIMLFAAATQGYFLVRNKLWETIALLIVAFTLFRPGFWLDLYKPPFEERPGIEIAQLAQSTPVEEQLRIKITGPSFNDSDRQLTTNILVPFSPDKNNSDRLTSNGLLVQVINEDAILEEPLPGSTFEHLGRKFDFYADKPVTVSSVSIPNSRFIKEFFYIPAALLLAIICLFQFSRRRLLSLRI